MARTVHLLKFYQEHSDFIEEITTVEYCKAMLSCGKRNERVFNGLVNKFNEDNNISIGPEFHKGLSLPRLKALMALVAQKKGYILNPSLCQGLFLDKTPERFQTKFKSLLVPGFYLIGKVIEDSLSTDPSVNLGNPFEFAPGDLGYWFAGVVIMDWLKYLKESKSRHTSCLTFYNRCTISRKYRYNQNSALSSFGLMPFQFIVGDDEEIFQRTIKTVDTRVNHICKPLVEYLESLKIND